MLVEVTNRARGSVGYMIPDTGAHRDFSYGETKKIDLEELKQLQWVPGGEYILRNYLIVNNTDALSALNMEVEPEYYYTEKEINELLSTGTLDQLEDALNFAPKGVIDLIQKTAVETQVPDTRKRKLITEKTGFNIDACIALNQELERQEKEAEQRAAEAEAAKIVAETRKSAAVAAPTRKSTPVQTSAGSATRKAEPIAAKPAAAPKYKVVSK